MHDNLDTLPPGYNFAQFLGKFCDFRLKSFKIKKLCWLFSSLSNLYGMIIKKFPFFTLKKTQMQTFIEIALVKNTPLGQDNGFL